MGSYRKLSCTEAVVKFDELIANVNGSLIFQGENFVVVVAVLHR
jgi:hypothetical protein